MTTTPVEILPGYFYVPIPEGAMRILLGRYFIHWETTDESFELALPPGSFTILFTRDEATEEKWKGVVEGIEMFYKNYVKGNAVFTATESGASLLRSHNLPVEDNFVIVKREK